MPSLALATKSKLLGAALKLVRTNGYAATTVDELCQSAGVTKGAFFHYFKSKEDLAVAATRYWTEITNSIFEEAPYNQYEDPLDRLIAYIEFRAQLMEGRSLPESTCLLGMLAQEQFVSSPAIRHASFEGIEIHANHVAEMIGAAKALHAPAATWSVAGLALHTQAVIQGAFVLAKAGNDVALATESIRHLRRYVELLFHYAKEE